MAKRHTFDDVISAALPEMFEAVEDNVLSRKKVESMMLRFPEKSGDEEEEGGEEEEEEEEELFDEWYHENELPEFGASICWDNEKKEAMLTGGYVSCSNAGCNIEEGCTMAGMEVLGSFHTHPLNGTTPSADDINHAKQQHEKFFCIGGKIDDRGKVTCYEPKDPEGFSVMEARQMFGFFGGGSLYYSQPDPIGEIQFFRGEPDISPQQILNSLQDEGELGEFIEPYGYEGVEALVDGNYPDGWWDDHETYHEGEKDAIDVYPDDAELERIRHEQLARDYIIHEYWAKKT